MLVECGERYITSFALAFTLFTVADLERSKAWPNITVKKAPPPDSKEWERKPDKFQYFSPNPGPGD